MPTKIQLVEAQDYEQKKTAAIAAGLHGERVAVFKDEALLRRWIDALGVRQELLDSQRCKP